METSIDYSLLHRLDQGALLDALSSIAHVLHQHDILSQTDSDDFRLAIRDAQRHSHGDYASVLTTLAADDNRFMRILQFRYGAIGFALNMARITLRPVIADLKIALAELGSVLLTKSQLMFNRTIKIHSGGTFQRQTLVSSLLVDICDSLDAALEDLTAIERLLEQMLPSDISPYTEQDAQIDDACARALGFEVVVAESTPFRTERLISQELSHLLLNFTDQITGFAEVCHTSKIRIIEPNIMPTCAWLRAEANRLSVTSFPDTEEIEAWELRRVNYRSAIAIVTATIRRLSKDLTSRLVVSTVETQEEGYMSKATVRSVISELVAKGVRVHQAEEAANKLQEYCGENRTQPSMIIPEEFPHIHPLLSKDCIARTSTDADKRATIYKTTPEKERISKRTSKLKSAFQMVLNANLLVLLLCLTTSCGFKTGVKSYAADLRPEIPFTPQALKIIEYNKKKDRENELRKQGLLPPESPAQPPGKVTDDESETPVIE